MSRPLLAGLMAAGGALLAWGARRRAEAAPVVEVAPELPPEIPPAEPIMPAPPVVVPRQSGRISASDVLALRPYADPEGWLPPADLLAFVEVESSFRPGAYRFEPHLNEASYGLMQVLASTARDMGHVDPPEAMFDPLTGLTIGVRYTRWVWDFLTRRLGREPTEAEWLSGYNMGVGNVLNGRLVPEYVRRWTAARDRYAGGA